ncbi:MAG: flagellar basal body P-ring formation chaperone FlgA [Melioribacteraceae bacterium]|nr:flagellar basal body P-ring formation chaperone FlgA [Melioribacteraceae bacterium]
MLMLFIYILSFITSVDDLPKEIKNRLEQEFSKYSRVEYKVVKAPKELNKLYFNEDDGINVIGSTAYISAYLIDKKGNKKRTTISVRIKIYEKVYISTKDTKKRDPINVSDFKLVEKEITALRGNIVASLGEVIGARAGRNIRKGDILTTESIENMPVIFPGDKVRAASIIGNVLISFSAFSRQEGSIGDVIRIRTKDNDIYKAEVIDYKNVLIIE